ncbi:hypothetical protein M1555_02005 [Patescibacteria group bacterium]|nr:hypothetical protein [Patescibacteria group bacterium]
MLKPECTEALSFDSPPELADVYGTLIGQDDRVMVVGPSISSALDAGLLYFLSRHPMVTILDPRFEGEAGSFGRQSVVVRHADGRGNIQHYLREIDMLRALGMPLGIPNWLGSESGLQKIGLPDASLDVIIDHDTLVYVCFELCSGRRNREHFLFGVLENYWRVLAPGGRLLLQTNNHPGRWGKRFFVPQQIPVDRLLREVGFSVDHETVMDILKIPITGEVFDAIRMLRGEVTATSNTGELWKHLRERDGSYWLEFDEPHHPSPDLYIACK